MAKSKLSFLPSFFRKYGDEIAVAGRALLTIASGIALDPRERQTLNEGVGALLNVKDAIEESMGKVEAALETIGEAKISKADVKAAVQEIVPDLLASLVEAGIKKALEDKGNG